MKTLICGPYPYKDQQIVGGVEAVIQNVKNGFNQYIPETDLHIASGSKHATAIYETHQDVTYIKEPRIKLGSLFFSVYPHRLQHYLKTQHFDVLNAHSPDFAYYGLQIKENLLFTLHGIIWEEKKFLPRYKQPLWHLLYVKKLNKIFKNLQYFVAINPYARHLVEPMTNATIFDICNPVPDEYFHIPDHREPNRMFYIGAISKRKNLFTLIQALPRVKQEMKKFTLVIAGKIFDNDYFQQIQEFITHHDLTENVEYIGKISEKRKFEEFSKMSFLVLPSLQETAPMVISEAFAASKTVIGSNICGIPYMINNGKNGFLIEPCDTKQLSDKILHLFQNPTVSHSFGREARQFAKRTHALEKIVKDYKKAYDIILSNHG